MSRIQTRVKEHLPSVLLTLLSIVQALALELLWARIDDSPFLYAATWDAAIGWTQIAAVFLGIVVIWVVYTSTAVRFSWLPSTSDSIYPFIIGIGEFLLVEAVGPRLVWLWLLEMAAVFAVMNWVSHHTLRRARLDGENQEFFRRLAPATPRDLYPAVATVAALSAAGVAFLLFDVAPPLAFCTIVVVNLLLVRQLYNAGVFWERSLDAADRSGPGRSA